MDCIITIDIGTNAVRIFAFEMNGNAIGFMKGSYPTFHTEPDYSEQDPEQVFITVLYVLKNFLNSKIKPKKYSVAAICFSAAMHSVLAVDKNGIPLGNAITWADNRGKKVADELKQSPLCETIYNATGTPVHPMSPLIKIAWLKKHDAERFKKTSKFISIKNYIIQQLTGDCVIDYSLASATGLFNIKKLSWDANALQFAGISAAKLPDAVPVFYSSLKLKKEYQVSLGLPVKTKLIIGASDGCMATLGAGVWGEGQATVTIEQSGAVRVAGNKILQDKQQRFFNYLLTEGYYVSGGPTNNGGVIFEWFTRQFGIFNDAYDLDDSINALIKEAAEVKAGADGLIFLPYLLGERAPLWNANARGAYFGLNIKHERQHFIRATLEGILYEMYSINKILEEQRSIKTLSINGSYASHPLWSQMIADIFGKTVNVSNSYDSIGTGALLLSQTEMGIYKNLQEAAQTVALKSSYAPNLSENATYMKYFRIFESLSGKLKDEFEQIALLQEKIG